LIPLPSVPLDDPAFEPDMWRGPVWVNTAYGVLRGLRRYGFHREASELAWRLCDGVYRVFGHERQIFEFYDPRAASSARLTRKRGNWWKRLTLGGGPQREFVGWSGLVNTLVIEGLFGFSSEDGRRVLRPRFPEAAAGAVLRLVLPAERLTVEIAVEAAESYSGFVQGGEGVRGFAANFGEAVEIDALLAKSASSAPFPLVP
jgi:glycogen debranching enzyme